jgi:hypothetical protein
VPSRGWGEQFWVLVTETDGDLRVGVIDNPLRETALHELQLGDEIVFHENHILAIHPSCRDDLLANMTDDQLARFGEWLRERDDGED